MISYIIIITMSVSMISIFVYKIYESSIRKNAVNYSANLVEQISANVSYKAGELEDYVLLQVRNFPYLFSKEQEESDYLTEYIRIREFSNLAVQLSYSRLRFEEVYIEDKDLRYVYSINGEVDKQRFKETELDRYIYQERNKIRSSWGRACWFTLPGKPKTVYMCRAIFSDKTTEYQGIIVAGISRDYFRSLYGNMNGTQGEKIVIFNNTGDIISCAREVYPMADYYRQYRLNEENFLDNTEHNEEEYLAAGNTSPDGKWRVMSFISDDELLKDTGVIKTWIIVTCVICLVIALIIAVVISANITGNIRLLLKKIRLLEKGDFTTQIKPSSYDEIGYLALEFNTMTVKLNELLKKVSKEEMEKQQAEYRALEAEYNALQAQINPHFLYNALESINSIAKLEKQDKISGIITAVATLLRGSIRQKNRIITLRQEFEYTKSYLDIQKAVHGDRIEVIFDEENDILDCEVPKLILQPIVENAICHGIAKKIDGGLIVVSAYRDNKLVIKVSDDGIGMSEEFLNRLFVETEDREEVSDKHTKAGIRSVDKRIKILYGEEYGLRISSQTFIGTTVEIMLPYIPFKEAGKGDV